MCCYAYSLRLKNRHPEVITFKMSILINLNFRDIYRKSQLNMS